MLACLIFSQAVGLIQPIAPLETRPSNLIRHATSNNCGPTSPCSNGATKMPSGLRASSMLGLASDSGRLR